MLCVAMFDWIAPGTTSITETSNGRHSMYSVSVYVPTAALLALYAPWPGRPRMPETLAMPTSVPLRRAVLGATNVEQQVEGGLRAHLLAQGEGAGLDLGAVGVGDGGLSPQQRAQRRVSALARVLVAARVGAVRARDALVQVADELVEVGLAHRRQAAHLLLDVVPVQVGPHV